MTTIVILLSLLCLIHYGNAGDCTKKDIKEHRLDCISKTRKVVRYLDSENCILKDTSLIKPYSIPCTCPPGSGLTNVPKPTCKKCTKGSFSAGGEDISDWGSWQNNGTVPPAGSGIVTFCEISRSYVKPCERWKASFFNDSLESGDNAKTRCMSTSMMMRKQFVGGENYVNFTYRVEGRQCYNSYSGCDGLSFYVDQKQVLKPKGNVFIWSKVRFNVSAGYHELKWVYRKNCYSFPTLGITDKAFIRSITLVGTSDPNTKCKPCPPGSYSDSDGASSCKKCDYFKQQPKAGQQSCSDCPKQSYSMPGAAVCIPMFNCTNDDLIIAPESIRNCKKHKDSSIFTRLAKPEYATVTIDKKSHLMCIPPKKVLKAKEVPCRCQPGLELNPVHPTALCRPCSKGQMSKDGQNCVKCPSGHVALKGKHYFWWDKGSLPEGFSANCAGDCPSKSGWISSGDHVRTPRVVGDVDSYLQSDTYNITSNIAYIAFNCSVLCNMSQPKSRIPGNHLVDIQYCNLVFQVSLEGSVVDQVNCTKPKGRYVHRHERRRDGSLVSHTYPLKKGSYQFRWVFSQADDLKSVSAAFEAKVHNISIVGVDGGSALSCTPCDPGYQSFSDNSDCKICPKGTYSKSGASACIPCKEGYFADSPGSGECLSCGATTTSLPTRDGCTNSGCMFTVGNTGIKYDFSRLSRVNGSMFTVLSYQQDTPPEPEQFSKIRDRRTSPVRLSIWPPYRPRFYLNLCTTQHDNSSCTTRKTGLSPRESLPVMGCLNNWWNRRDTSIGRVIGFKAKKDPYTGVIVELLHGDICRKPNKRFNSTIDLTCDVNAGVGSPGPENNHTSIFRSPCNYYFKWKSLYACPKCRKGELEKVTHPCINGTARVTLTRNVACWGVLDGMEVGETFINCSNDDSNHLFHVKRIIKVQQTVNKVLIGVGVVVIVALLIVAGYYFYKHRDFKYKYYGTLARNKPMSRLEEEDDDDFGHVEGDVFNDTHHIVNS